MMYVDGNEAARIPATDPTALNASMSNPALQLDGGQPIDLAVSGPSPFLVHSWSVN